MPASPEPLLRCEHLVVGHGSEPLLPPIDLTLQAGEFWAVIGRNGSGKTTFMRTVLGLLPPVSGSVRHEDATRLGYLPQRRMIDELYPLRVRDVIELSADRGRSFLRPRPRGHRERTAAILDEIGMSAWMDRPFAQLSEGQKQRVAFGRLVASGARLALLDEPTSAMDEVAEREAFELLDRLRRAHGMTVVIVSHYIGLASEFADHLLWLDRDARAVVRGSPAEVLADERFRARFGWGARAADAS